MLKRNTLARLLGWVLLSVMFGVLSACHGGGGTPNPIGLRPIITGLSKNAADINDIVEILGLHFGTTQESSQATLNGLDFTVVEWTDTKVKVTVRDGMASGIVVVTVGSLSSQSGSEAQLFIPAAPGTQPLISELTPDYGRVGEDQIVITGQGFGPSSATGAVFFTAVSETSLIQANVATVDVGGTPQEQWTHSSIKVWVPATAVTGPVFVTVNGVQSNSKQFTANPPTEPVEPPVISSFTPPNGEVGTVVALTGANFGQSQRGSVITLAGLALNMLTWSDTEISASIPTGAATGYFKVKVGGEEAVSASQFIVANTPVITGVSPSQLRIGQPVTVYGQYFGTEPGTGALRIGSTTIPSPAWTNTRLDVTILQPITYTDANSIPVVVTAANGLSSAPFNVSLVSDLTGQVTVDPTAGVQNSSPGSGDGTPFTFTTEVVGGSETSTFMYSLIPDITHPDVFTAEQAVASIVYRYDTKGTFTTAVKVRDTSTGDSVTLDGPAVLVVGVGEPVITKIATAAYARAQDAPNDYCYVLDATSQPVYDEFFFASTQTIFASHLAQVSDGGNPVPGITRDHKSFLYDGLNPRPYGYRYTDADVVPAINPLQGAVVLQGFNFGATTGQIWLNSAGPGDGIAIIPAAIVDWSDTEVSFTLPDGAADNLSGNVTIEASSGNSFTTGSPLICSPSVASIAPNTHVNLTTTVTLQGYDLVPPQVTGIAGSQTFVFWIMPVSYTDNWVNPPAVVTKYALRVEPVPATVLGGNTIELDMSLLNGQQLVEVFNADGTAEQLIQATPQSASDVDWFFFLWTGALGSGSSNQKALSGVFSEAYVINMGGGPGPGTNNISGHVQDDTAADLPGVTVTLTPGGLTATTDATGDYTIASVPDGSYDVTPSLAGYTFAPPSRNVTVPPDATGVDFVGSTAPPTTITIWCKIYKITAMNPPPNPPDAESLVGASVAVWPCDATGTITGEKVGDFGPSSLIDNTVDPQAPLKTHNLSFTVPKGDPGDWYKLIPTHPDYPNNPPDWDAGRPFSLVTADLDHAFVEDQAVALFPDDQPPA